MYKNYWLLVFVAIGWLNLSGPLLAQSPSSEGVPSEAPTVEKNHQGQTSTGENSSLNFSLPVRIIENPEQAKRANETEKESRKHDQSDLEAQWKAADSAFDNAKYSKDQLRLSWWQFWLAAAGTVALIYSILLNRRATNAAIVANTNTIRAIDQEHANAQMQLRAYLTASDARFYNNTNSRKIVFTIKISNVGHTPARNISITSEVWATRTNVPDIEFIPKTDVVSKMGIMTPGINQSSEVEASRAFTDDELIEFQNGGIVFWAQGRADYIDAFGKERWITFKETYSTRMVNNVFSTDNAVVDGGYDGN